MADNDAEQLVDAEPINRAPRRPRFSLLTLLLLMTIAGMGFALVRQGIEIVPLREEVRKLRDELGILHIEDPEKIYAIQVETFDYSFNKFRIHIPRGRKYSLNYAYSNIPIEGEPEPSGSSMIQPGEYIVYVRKKDRLDPKTGKPTQYATMDFKAEHTKDQNLSFSYAVSVSGNWIYKQESGRSHCSISRIGMQVETFSADQPVSLIRFRESLHTNVKRGPNGEVLSYSVEAIEEPCDGFMIWIESEKPVASEE